MKDATHGVQWAAVPGAECMLLSNAGIFLRTAKSLTNSYGVAIIEDVQPGYYQARIYLRIYATLVDMGPVEDARAFNNEWFRVTLEMAL